MKSKKGFLVRTALTFLAFFIGLFGIAVFFAVDNRAGNNTIAAFAAVSVPFALLTGLLSWLVPEGQWAIAAAMSAPLALVSFMGAWSSIIMLPGAIWTIALTFCGGYLGSRLRLSRSETPNIPPS